MTGPYDIVVVTDPRVASDSNSSLVKEIRALVASGYTTGVMPLASGLPGAQPVAANFRELLQNGLVEWVRPDDETRCRLALAREPSIFLEPQPVPVRLQAERVVLVANDVRADADLAGTAYEPGEVDARLIEFFGQQCEWIPVNDDVRAELGQRGLGLAVSAETWPDVHETVGPDTYLARLERLIGHPSRQPDHAPLSAHSAAPTHSALSTPHKDRPRVLFITDNGHGLGHISRVLAIATRCSDDVAPFMLTLSEAYGIAANSGVPTEYFPSARRLDVDRMVWHEMLRLRVKQVIDRLRPSLVVVDHVNPPSALINVFEEAGPLRTMWLRRGLWRAGYEPSGVNHAQRFEFVLEPVDIAAPFDRGVTATMWHPNTHYVDPINLVGQDEMLDRDEARKRLGLPADGLAILVNMSADSTDVLLELIIRVRDLVRRREPHVSLFAPVHVLHADQFPGIDGVVTKPIYPVAPYLYAFDAAVSTSGYNTFHEVVLARTPCVFWARQTDAPDDQSRRASAAVLGGFGRWVEDIWSDDFEKALDAVLDPVRARRMRKAAGMVHPGNGAGQAARLIAAIAQGREVQS